MKEKYLDRPSIDYTIQSILVQFIPHSIPSLIVGQDQITGMGLDGLLYRVLIKIALTIIIGRCTIGYLFLLLTTFEFSDCTFIDINCVISCHTVCSIRQSSARQLKYRTRGLRRNMTESGFSTMGFFDERFPEYCSIPMKALVGPVY